MEDLSKDLNSLIEKFKDPEWGAMRLRDVPMFAAFAAPELRSLYKVGRLAKLKQKTHAVVEGEPTRGMYLLLHGVVSVYKTDTATGNMTRLAMLEEGASFGELSLFDHAPRSATVVAESTCIMFQLDADDFNRFLDQQGNDLKVRFFKSCAEQLAERFRVLNGDYLTSQKLLWQYALRKSDKVS